MNISLKGCSEELEWLLISRETNKNFSNLFSNYLFNCPAQFILELFTWIPRLGALVCPDGYLG